MSSSVAKEWNSAAVRYFDPDGPSNRNQTNNVHDFIAEVSYMAQIIGPQATRENLQSSLRGLTLSVCSHPVIQSYVARGSGIERWIAALLIYFDTDDTNKEWDYCLKKAAAGYKCYVRGYVKAQEQASQEREQREHDNQRREQQRLERVKRFEEQETARQQYEIEQQRIREEQEKERQKRLDELEIERQKAEQKAKDEAFACRRCPEKFSSNTKLHKHIAAHHIKPARASSAALAPAQVMAISSSALPTPLTPTTPTPPTTSSAPPRTPSASTPPTTPKSAKATSSALLTPPATPTPPTTPKIARLSCAMPKPAAYMTMDDLFRKFAPSSTQHQHAANEPQSLQMPSPILRQKTTVAHSLATFSALNERARSSNSAPNSTYTRFAAACQKFSPFAIPTWEWTKQFGLRLRAWV